MCSRCRKVKAAAEFNLDRSRKDGLQRICRSCTSTGRSRYKNSERAYKRSARGTARDLRNHYGFSPALSEHWAAILHHDHTRCSICGIPQKEIRRHTERGRHWILGRSRRMTLDHIIPGVEFPGNYRPLCSNCNSTRKNEAFTDEEVLRATKDKWEWAINRRFLRWMCSSPGVGGKIFRTERVEKRELEYPSCAPLQEEEPNGSEGNREG